MPILHRSDPTALCFSHCQHSAQAGQQPQPIQAAGDAIAGLRAARARTAIRTGLPGGLSGTGGLPGR